MSYVKALRCLVCGTVDNKAPAPENEPRAPDGPCEECGSEEYYVAVLPEE